MTYFDHVISANRDSNDWYRQFCVDIERQMLYGISPTTEGTTMTITEDPIVVVEQPTLELQIERLQEEKRKLEYDLSVIARKLVHEARERGWCSDYGTFIDDVNSDTYGDWLQSMDRELEITVSFCFDWETSTDSDNVVTGLRNRIRAMLQDSYDQDEPHIDVRVSG